MISRSRGFFVLALLAIAVRVCAGGIVRDDVVLGGPEIAAARLAIDDFIQHHYSTSGDLSHYRIRFHHERDTLEIDFIPDTDPRGPYPGGAPLMANKSFTHSRWSRRRFSIRSYTSDNDIIQPSAGSNGGPPYAPLLK